MAATGRDYQQQEGGEAQRPLVAPSDESKGDAVPKSSHPWAGRTGELSIAEKDGGKERALAVVRIDLLAATSDEKVGVRRQLVHDFLSAVVSMGLPNEKKLEQQQQQQQREEAEKAEGTLADLTRRVLIAPVVDRVVQAAAQGASEGGSSRSEDEEATPLLVVLPRDFWEVPFGEAWAGESKRALCYAPAVTLL